MADKSVTSNTPAHRAQWLRALTRPESVAIIGASDDQAKLQARPMRFLARHGFAGQVLPINPGRSTVLGLPAWPDLGAAPGPIDHAYVLLNTEAAVEAVSACAAQGVKAVTVLADGFAESGPAGIARQQKIAAIARSANMLLIGPNSTGVVDTRSGFSCTTNAAFATDKPPAGKMAVISQSGSMIGAVYSRGRARGLGFSTLISVGNEALAGVAELGNLLLDDPGHDAFLLFMETVRNPQALAAFAHRAHDLGKPVVCYMIGRSDEGQALSATHTGAMMGSGKAVSSFFRRHGIVEVENFEALLEAPGALLRRAALADRPRHVTVLTTTGGGGAMVVDKLGEHGVAIAGCSVQTRQALEAQQIPLGHGKLIDVTLAGARYESMKAVVSTLIADPHTGALLVAIGSSAQFEPERAVKPLIDAVAAAPATAAPVLAFPLPHAEQSLRLFSEAGIPAFQTLESCVESVAMLMRDDVLEPRLTTEQVKSPGIGSELSACLSRIEPRANGLLNEVEAGVVFAAAGLSPPPQIFVRAGESVPDNLPIELPAVVKVVSADLAHKSDVGGVQLNLASIDEVRDAVSAVQDNVRAQQPDAQIDGVLIQAMQTGIQEMLVGLTRDPLVGPMLTVGFGGINTEIYSDTVVQPAPVSALAAKKMVQALRGAPLLNGYRGKPLADINALIDAIVAVSEFASIEQIEEAEINPLLVCKQEQGVVMLDALVRVKPTSD
ncbi:MAG: acetate--CoA ligase family protein [Burkholderiaceae bacterium]